MGIPYLRTETYDTLHTYRTLAASEAVALVHVVYFGRARALMRWVLRVPEGVHQIVRDSEPGVADNKALFKATPHRNSSLCNQLQRKGSVTNYVRNKKG